MSIISLQALYRERILPRLAVSDVYDDAQLRRAGRQLRGPCPLHGGRRNSFVVDPETLCWCCHADCQAGGDPAAYVMRHDRLTFAAAVRELARRAGVDVNADQAEPHSVRRRMRRATPSAPEEPDYPPLDEVQIEWARGIPVTEAGHVAEYLRRRRIDPIAVADRDLARACITSTASPRWAGCRRGTWAETGFSLIAPMNDAYGEMRSLDARSVFGAGVKSLPPRGYTRRGLVMLCPLARQLLTRAAQPEWWPPDVPLRIEIVEGSKKWMQRITSRSEANAFAPAVFGIVSGSWTDVIAERIPAGASVYAAVDPDLAGSRYADKILETLAARIARRELDLEIGEGVTHA